MKPIPFTQQLTVRARLVRRIARTYLGSDEIRWRMLITTGRFTSHIAIIGVALLAVILAGAHLGGAPSDLPADSAGASSPDQPPADQPATGSGHIYSPVSLQSYTSLLNQDGGLVARRAVADTLTPTESRGEIITYTVQSGDTIETIAARFRILPTTLVWSNQDVEDQPDRLSIGQILYVLPVDGIWYSVQSNDTVGSIAGQFRVKPEDIINFPMNNLTGGANLLAGNKIIVPNGVKPYIAKVVASSSGAAASGGAYSGPAVNVAGSGRFQWPTTGMITQGYYAYHRAIDIANAVGIPVAAADGGYVVYAGWDGTGYGYMLLINHGNGFSTLYAHLSQYFVDPGQAVRRGQVIALMGSTGNSTGPHLHFEVRYGGVQQNPLFYLP